ncbi:MAG TPA: hypothetical protein VLK29_10120 [Luteimonas sp.]|nr:hypothetical protein [Luteimonas sp.]
MKRLPKPRTQIRQARAGGLPIALLAVFAVGCAVAAPPPVPPSPSPMADRMHDDTLQLRQGTTGTYLGSRLGYLGGDGSGGVRIDVWTEASGWQARHVLRQGAIFPAGGGFLRVDAVTRGEPAGSVTLAAASDSGGLAAPDATQPVLPAGGRLEIGAARIELAAPIAPDAVQLRQWPRILPLERTPAAEVERRTLRAGDVLAVGERRLRLVRIQPDAGDVGGFAVFALD